MRKLENFFESNLLNKEDKLLIFGGVNSITDGTNTPSFQEPRPKSASCTSGCSVQFSGDDLVPVGDNWTYDY